MAARDSMAGAPGEPGTCCVGTPLTVNPSLLPICRSKLLLWRIGPAAADGSSQPHQPLREDGMRAAGAPLCAAAPCNGISVVIGGFTLAERRARKRRGKGCSGPCLMELLDGRVEKGGRRDVDTEASAYLRRALHLSGQPLEVMGMASPMGASSVVLFRPSASAGRWEGGRVRLRRNNQRERHSIAPAHHTCAPPAAICGPSCMMAGARLMRDMSPAPGGGAAPHFNSGGQLGRPGPGLLAPPGWSSAARPART